MTTQCFDIVDVVRMCNRCQKPKPYGSFKPLAHICNHCVLYGGHLRGRFSSKSRSYSLTAKAHDLLEEMRANEQVG